MEPITVAISAFSALKTGVRLGKDLSSLTKEIGTLWNAIDDTKKKHEKKKRSPFRSVEEEALNTFIDKKQADDMEEQLRLLVIATRGHSGWQELLRLRGQIRKERQAEQERVRKRRRQILEIVIGSVALLFGLAGLIGFALYLVTVRP